MFHKISIANRGEIDLASVTDPEILGSIKKLTPARFWQGAQAAAALAVPDKGFYVGYALRSAYYVPPAPRRSPIGTIQLNDVFVDERGVVYSVDRIAGGLYVFELKL